ncbi:cleavage and polyadenylation specificity factor subunit 5 [Trypanosoma grayi]|uniref:cleavage and polyadenylation specificity factor subunit 5 n=1 Tax=Trypanosoma grayi TaxID=71804 RepID=UPI0004F4782F|nr:cleavage and polyadenylation specificity factor subunit 5 [Trypanosoma grayi]KEG11218.1 cleavage and polyadenylation specificity factor subunit 5 [Trypanosoma grayi]
MYPYVPAHVPESDVKEVRTVFLVHMPPQMMLTVTHPDVQLVAAPLFDLYENTAKYGPLIASIPTLLSRVNINYCK